MIFVWLHVGDEIKRCIMPVEIERKFLVVGEFPRLEGVKMVQGYLCAEVGRNVRIRTEGERAVLTIKGGMVGITRQEFEYEIPIDDAKELLKMAAGSLVEKTRYFHREGTHTWEIDVFGGENEGLVIAELELGSEDEAFVRPDWVGEEVSTDPRYSNSLLSIEPYSSWA